MSLHGLTSTIKQHPIPTALLGFLAVILFYTIYAWSPEFPEDLPSSESTSQFAFSTEEKTALETRIKTHFLRLHGDLSESESTEQSNQESLHIRQTYHRIDEAKLLQAAQSLAKQNQFIVKVQKATSLNITEPIYQLNYLYQQAIRVKILIFLTPESAEPIATRIKVKAETAASQTNTAANTEATAEVATSQAKLVIIIDDLGQNYTRFLRLAELNENFTFSILPELPYSQKTIAKATELELEIMLHIPMQPKDWPRINPGKGALMVEETIANNQSTLSTQIAQNSAAKGANNHMGSAFTQSVEGMEMVMEALRERGMFFIDSKTAAGKISKNAAEKFGVPFLQRDYFLDNEQDISKIQAQIQKAGKLALQRGWAIAICHPYPATYEALQLELENLQEQGITITRASELLSIE